MAVCYKMINYNKINICIIKMEIQMMNYKCYYKLQLKNFEYLSIVVSLRTFN